MHRLFELVPHRGSAALNQIQDEIEQEAREREEGARERVLDETVWHAAHMEIVPAYDPVNGNPMGYQERVKSTDTITLRQLPEYARKHGIDVEKLRAVLEGRASEIKTKGGERLRGWPYVFVDHSLSQEDADRWESDYREGLAIRKRQEERQKNKQAALSGLTTSKIWKVDE